MDLKLKQRILAIRKFIGEKVDVIESKESFADIAKPILFVEADLNSKLNIIDFKSLLANNGKNNQTLTLLCEFLERVEVVCVDLKKRLPESDFIPATHPVYLNMLEIKGGKELFQLIGFSESDSKGLKISDQNIPDLFRLMDLLIDIIIARCELIEFLLGNHPRPHSIHQAIKEFTDSDHSCSICGVQQTIVICNFCSAKSLCEKCDVTWHSHPKRIFHDRIKRNPVSQRYDIKVKARNPKELENVDYIPSSHNIESHKASHSKTESQKEQTFISDEELNDASEMSIQKLKLVLIDLSRGIKAAEKAEQKQTLRRKWNAFFNVFNKKVEDNILELTEHIKTVERHIQILVMKDPDFYRRESYGQLNDDKMHTQKKLSEMRTLRECCSNQTSPEEFSLNFAQMLDAAPDENKTHQTMPLLGSTYNSDSDLYAKNSPQKYSSSTSTPEFLEKSTASYQTLTLLNVEVAPPPDVEYQSSWIPPQWGEKDFPILSQLSSKQESLLSPFHAGERKRSNTMSDIPRSQVSNTLSALFDSHNCVSKPRNLSQEESGLSCRSRNEMQCAFGRKLPHKPETVYPMKKDSQMLYQEKLKTTEAVLLLKESSVDPEHGGVLLNQAAASLSPARCLSKSLDTSSSAVPLAHSWNISSPAKESKKMSVTETMSQLHEKKMMIEMQTKAGEVVRYLRLAEVNGYDADVMLISLEKHEQDGMDPLDWIKYKWPDYISTVIALADNKNIRGLLEDDVANALKKHKGNVEKALDSAIKLHRKRVEQIKTFGDFTDEEIVCALQKHNGNIDCIVEDLFAPRLAEFKHRIWQHAEEEEEECSNDSSLPQQLVDLLLNKDIDPERRVRAAFSEISFKGWRRAEYVIKILDNHLENVDNCQVSDVVDVVQNSNSFENAVEQLTIVCNLCLNQYPQGKIMTLSFCNCKFCQECFLQNFKIRIREEPVRRWTCPTCSLPELNDEETVTNYFAFLNLQLKQVIDEDTFNLYETKLRDWHLHKDPNFRWCPSCENGFLYHADGLKMNCPHCNRATCFQCMKPWQDQHQRLSCEKFNDWLIANDPNNQALGLKLILKKNGIICPECHTPYVLAKGGCIHFTCKTCQHEFCAGCQKTFYQKERCHKFNDCPTKGIHAHHPRDCLYYLRDEDAKTLQKLLKSKNVHYDVQAQTTQEDPQHCFIMVQKEINGNTLRDEKCGSDVPDGYAGLCLIHYKEYLVSLINQNKIDPVPIYTTDSLKQILSRNDRNIPEKGRGMSDKEYRRNLEELVKQTEQLAFGD